MSQWVLKVDEFPRKRNFPFQVDQIYYCNEQKIQVAPRQEKFFEICLRLPSSTDSTEDIVNGKYLKMPCPNVALRLPGSIWSQPQPSIRNVISFCYSPEVPEKINLLGLNVENEVRSFVQTSETDMLIAKLIRTVHSLHTPGAADILDWTCFSLLATLQLQDNMTENAAADLKSRIHNVAIWFRTHFAEKIDIDEISSANGFSHDHFFKCWKRYFALTPVQFINNLRLEAAAQRLIETNISVSEIIKEVNFAGEYMFYKRFRQKYAMTPAEYRRSHTLEDLE